MKLRISGLSEANEMKKQGIPDKIVSLVDPAAARNLAPDDNHLVIPMHDIDQKMTGWIWPNEDHVREVLEFSRGFNKDDKVLVHCHAGVSRSTAMAIGILIQHGMTLKDAVEYVFEIRDCAWPNALIIEILDKELNLNGELSKEVGEAKKRINEFHVKKPAGNGPTQSEIDAMERLKKLLG